MKAKAILQVNKETGEKALTLTQDPTAKTEDFLITAGNWRDAEVIVSEVLILTDDDRLADALLEAELRTDMTVTEPHFLLSDLPDTPPRPRGLSNWEWQEYLTRYITATTIQGEATCS